MQTPQYHLGVAANATLFGYCVAIWSETAYYAGEIGFLEELTWSRMLAAYRLTGLRDVLRLEASPLGVIAVGGMLAAILAALLPNWRVPHWAFAVYTAVLLVAGGAIGLVALVFAPFDTLDGEFLAEGLARLWASGLWTAAVCASALQRALLAKRERTVRGAAA